MSKSTRNKILVYAVLYVMTSVIIASTFILSPDHSFDLPILRTVIIFFATTLLIKYFLYMVISPWHDLAVIKQTKRRQKNRRSSYRPKVSVLIPTWNEEDGVITTAETLMRSVYENMEIIFINNASTDNTKKNIKDFINKNKKSKIELIYAEEKTQGKGHALNKGLRIASGDIIITIDADCFITPLAITNFVKRFEDPTVMAAVGNVKIGKTDSVLGVIQHLEFLLSFYFKKGDSFVNTIYIIGGAAGAFRKEVFEIIGNYNVSNITEDIELSVRIQDAGMKIVYADDAHILTEGAANIRGLIKQRTRWKIGRIQTFIEQRHLFFSTKKNHNKILTWIVLPLAIFGDLQLLFEPFFLVLLYVFSYLTNDYSSFISGVIVVSSMFVIQVAFDAHHEKRWRFIALAPIGWLLFYVTTFIEFNALLRSVTSYLLKKEVKWQKWERKGVI